MLIAFLNTVTISEFKYQEKPLAVKNEQCQMFYLNSSHCAENECMYVFVLETFSVIHVNALNQKQPHKDNI